MLLVLRAGRLDLLLLLLLLHSIPLPLPLHLHRPCCLLLTYKLDLRRTYEAQARRIFIQFQLFQPKRPLIPLQMHAPHIRDECSLCEKLDLRQLERQALQLLLDRMRFMFLIHVNVPYFFRQTLLFQAGEEAVALAGEKDEQGFAF